MNESVLKNLKIFYRDRSNAFLSAVCQFSATEESYFAAFEVLRERGYFLSEEYDKSW